MSKIDKKKKRSDDEKGKPAAIVTAAGSGIGAECARELASCGYQVSLFDISASVTDLAEALGGIGFQGSILENTDLEHLVAQTYATYGRLDAVVINTGHAHLST